MSQLFDSLRRASRVSRVSQPRRIPVPSDAVLARLGFSRVQRGESVTRVAAVLGSALVVGGLLWYTLQRSATPGAEPAPSPQSAVSVPQDPPVAPPSEQPAEGPAGVAIATRPNDQPPDIVRSFPAPGSIPVERSSTAETLPVSHGARRVGGRPAQPDSSTVFEEFRRAVEHQRAGDLDGAVRIYRSLLGRGHLTAEVRK